MLSVSSQSSNSDPQLEGHTSFLTVPPSPRPSISLPAQSCCPPSPGNVRPHSFSQNPPISTLSSARTPVPYRDTATPISLLPWGTRQTGSPSLCPDLRAVPPSVGGLGHIPRPQHLGTSRSLRHSHLGRPFPMGHAGTGQPPVCPCPACLARTARRALLPHPVPPCTCCLPRSGSAPLPVPGTQGSPG